MFLANLPRIHGADDARTGLTQVMNYSLFIGIPVVLMPRFEPVQFCRDVEKYRISSAFVVPPVFLALLHHPGT